MREELGDRLFEASAERDRLSETLGEVQARLAGLTQELKAATEQRAAVDAEIAEARDALHESERAREKLAKDLQAASAGLEEVRNQVHAAEQEHGSLGERCGNLKLR